MMRKRVDTPIDKHLLFPSKDDEYAFQIQDLGITKIPEYTAGELEKESKIQKKIAQYLKFGDISIDQRRALIIILLIVFIDLFAVGLVYPMIPFYASELVYFSFHYSNTFIK